MDEGSSPPPAGLRFTTWFRTSNKGCSDDEIIRWIPSLNHKEIRIIERYYRPRKDELDEYERAASELTARSGLGRSGFVSQSRKEAALSAEEPWVLSAVESYVRHRGLVR